MVALEIDTAGRKHVLGLREGATETAAVSTALLNDLVTRGLPTDRTTSGTRTNEHRLRVRPAHRRSHVPSRVAQIVRPSAIERST